VFEFKINKKRADHNKANAPRRRKDEEERVWVHYTYYYYPNIEIYEQLETGMWFFRDGPKWKAASILPGKLKKKRMQDTYKAIK
jgi:hypothetical protein